MPAAERTVTGAALGQTMEKVLFTGPLGETFTTTASPTPPSWSAASQYEPALRFEKCAIPSASANDSVTTLCSSPVELSVLRTIRKPFTGWPRSTTFTWNLLPTSTVPGKIEHAQAIRAEKKTAT